ncbi:MAG: hypothetical protein ACJ746_17185 [Bryobacteraceae bacterium]
MQYAYEGLLSAEESTGLGALTRFMDLSRAAVVGHSFGGAAAAELCRTDQRFRAGVNLDGWMFSGVKKEGISTPFLFVMEDDPLWFKNEGPFGKDEAGVVRAGTLAITPRCGTACEPGEEPWRALSEPYMEIFQTCLCSCARHRGKSNRLLARTPHTKQ